MTQKEIKKQVIAKWLNKFKSDWKRHPEIEHWVMENYIKNLVSKVYEDGKKDQRNKSLFKLIDNVK
jgi:hypothetical protein